MRYVKFGATAAMLILGTIAPQASAAAPSVCAADGARGEAAAKPKKKRGFGLGGLLKAANEAGVGNLLGTGNMLGSDKVGQVAGAVAGTAIATATGNGNAAAGLPGQVAGLADSHRVAQIAGAVTGTATQLARSVPKAQPKAGTATPTGCSAAPTAPVTQYR